MMGNQSKTLMSLLPLQSPKQLCQIQRDWFTIASRFHGHVPTLILELALPTNKVNFPSVMHTI
jgi:hypothetical protein